METITLHSTVPESLGEFHLHNKEYMQYLYFPIKLVDSFIIELEPRLEFLENIIAMAVDNECSRQDNPLEWFEKQYVYLTIKQTFLPKGGVQNRPGFHSDGFMTNDVQYLWFDRVPTEFMIGEFELLNDDQLALQELDNYYKSIQAGKLGADYYLLSPLDRHLYRIDHNHIHRPRVAHESGPRLFVHISISEHKYAQEGNSHNYKLNYDWTMKPRRTERNQPHESNASNS